MALADTEHSIERVRSSDVEIAVRRFGKLGRTPLIVNHGLSFFSYDWIGIAAALAADRPVAAMDMRGFGESGWSAAKDYGLAAFAGDIAAVLDRFGWPQAVVVGHSMGGRNAVYFAAEQRERAAALVLVDYTPSNAPAGSQRIAEHVGRTPDRFPTVEAAMAYFGADPAARQARARFDAVLARTEDGFALKRDPYFRDQFRRILDTGERPKLGVDMWQVLGKVACPTLVLRGARSDLFGRDSVERMQAELPRFAFTEVDAGHNVAGDNPAALLREIRAFLEQKGL